MHTCIQILYKKQDDLKSNRQSRLIETAKMKIAAAVVFLGALVACSAVPPSYVKNTRTLEDDLNDFVELVPTGDILGIVLNYIANDDEFQRVILYVLSDDFGSIIQLVDSIDEYIEVSNNNDYGQ